MDARLTLVQSKVVPDRGNATINTGSLVQRVLLIIPIAYISALQLAV